MGEERNSGSAAPLTSGASKSSTPRTEPSLTALFLVFLRVGLTAFGGSTQAWTYREVVEKRHWLDENTFLSGFTVAQVLPGSNPLNVALYVGTQLRGVLGATVSALGMVIPAFCVIMLMGYLYRDFGNSDTVHAILRGVAAVGIGATLSVGFRVGRRLPRKIWPFLVAATMFVTVGLLHWPLMPVVLITAPVSVLLAYWFGAGQAVLDNRIIGLVLVFAPLSLFSFGGGQAIIADIQHQVVDSHGWLTGPQFSDMFGLARAAPGPTTLIAALIGWQVGGFLGAIVATLAMYIPSSIVVLTITRWWIRTRNSPGCAAIELGLAPVAIGLIFAGALSVIEASHMDALALATTAVAASVLYFTKVGPYVLIAIAVVLYAGLQFV